MGHGGGLVLSVLSFYFTDICLNPAEHIIHPSGHIAQITHQNEAVFQDASNNCIGEGWSPGLVVMEGDSSS